MYRGKYPLYVTRGNRLKIRNNVIINNTQCYKNRIFKLKQNKMKNSKNVKTVKTVESAQETAQRIFAEFQAKQAEMQNQIEIAKEIKRNEKRSTSEHISMKNNALIEIYNAGLEGITIAKLMQCKPIQNKKEAYNIHTINRDWNRYSAVQSEQENLNEKGCMVAFTVEFCKPSPSLKSKNNNRIILPQVFRETLKAYLLANNVKEEMLKEI